MDDSTTTQQGKFAWEDIPPSRTARRGGKERPREIVDVGAFRRLVKRGFDGRPKDARETKECGPTG
jgi:hypothetical protein